MRTTRNLSYYPMQPEQTAAEALAGEPCELRVDDEMNGEAVACLDTCVDEPCQIEGREAASEPTCEATAPQQEERIIVFGRGASLRALSPPSYAGLTERWATPRGPRGTRVPSTAHDEELRAPQPHRRSATPMNP